MIWYILISESVSVYGRFVIGLSSGLSVCCRLRFQHCPDDRFSIGAMSVIYRSQIGRFHTESYPKWPRHDPDWFYGAFSNIVFSRQLADSLTILRFLSVLCRYGRCDSGIKRVKIRSRQIGCYNDRIGLQFDRHLDSAVAEAPVKFLGDW